MKKIFFLMFLILIFSSSVFAFGYISLLQTENDFIVSGDAYFGYWVFYPITYWGVGATAEIKMFTPNLFIGGSVFFDTVSWDLSSIYTNYKGSAFYLSLSAYAKYFILNGEQTKEIVGMPFIVGAAAGFGFGFDFAQASIGTTNISILDSYSQPFKILAVGIIGYEMKLFGSNVKASLSMGIIDNVFDYSVDLWFPGKDDKSYFHLYWVPILGIGASYTLSL